MGGLNVDSDVCREKCTLRFSLISTSDCAAKDFLVHPCCIFDQNCLGFLKTAFKAF